MIGDYILLVFRNFSRRQLRGWLTILGVLIGIAAVVSLISVAQGMQQAITGQFEKLGTNKLVIMPGGGMGFGALSSTKLGQKDLDVVKKARGVDLAAEMLYKTAQVKYGDETKSTFVIGFPTDETAKIIEDMQGFQAEKGRMIKEGDKNKVAIGWVIWSDEFFSKSVQLRDKLEIEGIEFKVVGLVKKIGNRQDDTQMYVTMDAARELFQEPDEISAIYVQIKGGYTPEQVAEQIKKDLRKSRNEKENEETFQVQTFEQILEQVNTVLGVVGLVLIVIALISLVVGGVGIMNTMYTSVLERTREIGVMKAIGAQNWQILTIFMLESGFYGMVGGLIGVAIGFTMAKGGELVAAAAGYEILKMAMPMWLVFGSLGFSFVVGCIAGLAPAYQASRLKPVDALRYE